MHIHKKASIGPISIPEDLTLVKELKSKNDSKFTNSLIRGDNSGYTVGHGIQNERFPKRNKQMISMQTK